MFAWWEAITLPCQYDDSKCEPGASVGLQALVFGTSFAAPQVAGLAAWLWALSTSLSVSEAIGLLRNCYDGRWVDAYKAVLSLDHSVASAGIRFSLLDVAGANGQIGSDLKFDEKDLKMIFDSIQQYEADRAWVPPPWEKDHSPFDFNGDGYAGDTSNTRSGAPFDLDINSPPGYTQVLLVTCVDTSFAEALVTDRDILYYSYSRLYTGNGRMRDSLLGCGRNVYSMSWMFDASAGAHLDDQYNTIMLSGRYPYDTTFSVRPAAESPLCVQSEGAGNANANTDMSGQHSFSGPFRDLTSVTVGGTATFIITFDPDSLCLDRLQGGGAVSYALDFEVAHRPGLYWLNDSVDAATQDHPHSNGVFNLRFQGTTEEGQHFTRVEDTQISTSISVPSGGSAGTLQPHCLYNLRFQLSLLGIYDGDATISMTLQLTDITQ
jgi:hypothetical protein